MRPDTQNWIASADYDLKTAQHMQRTGRYLYVLFMRHLALEKMLKAHVTEATQSPPAKTHDLIYLVKKSGLELPQTDLEFLGKINNASIPTRYPEDLRAMIKQYPKPIALAYLSNTKRVIKWLKQHPNLNR